MLSMMVLLICPLLSSFVHNVVFDVVLHVFLNKVDHEIVFIFAVLGHLPPYGRWTQDRRARIHFRREHLESRFVHLALTS